MELKKISVCHGPTCGSQGGPKIFQILKDYFGTRIPVEPRECCGRCSENNTIAVNDEVFISRLNPSTLHEKFLNDSDGAIAGAMKEQDEMKANLEKMLSNTDDPLQL